MGKRKANQIILSFIHPIVELTIMVPLKAYLEQKKFIKYVNIYSFKWQKFNNVITLFYF